MLDMITKKSLETGTDPTESIFHAFAVLVENFGTLTEAGRDDAISALDDIKFKPNGVKEMIRDTEQIIWHDLEGNITEIDFARHTLKK